MTNLKAPIIDIKKYGGRQVALVKGKVVASGRTTPEVLEKARLRLPRARWDEILLVGVPKSLYVVYKV